MNFNILFLSLGIFIGSFYTNSYDRNVNEIISDFNKIITTPEIISFSNSFEINNEGGHLQGIQRFINRTGEFLFMSGSSDSYSYCSVVKLNDENKVVAINRLMDKPFKHAGGFQVFQNYLAVGIEDNSLKDKSKVCIFDISNPENPFNEPISVIERSGEPLRSTAGCVGITNYKNGILLAVGDWDTKHIDFYFADSNDFADSKLSKVGSINTENISKANWIDNQWHSYQNINLFNINNQLILIGLGKNNQSDDIADLYMVIEESTGNFSFKKVASKTFNCTNECNFKASAGADYSNGKFTIIASGYNISSTSYLNVFGSK